MKEEEIPVAVTVDRVFDAFINSIAQSKALPDILLKERPVLDAGELDAFRKRDYSYGGMPVEQVRQAV